MKSDLTKDQLSLSLIQALNGNISAVAIQQITGDTQENCEKISQALRALIESF